MSSRPCAIELSSSTMSMRIPSTRLEWETESLGTM
jgi:hypothetical protein